MVMSRFTTRLGNCAATLQENAQQCAVRDPRLRRGSETAGGPGGGDSLKGTHTRQAPRARRMGYEFWRARGAKTGTYCGWSRKNAALSGTLKRNSIFPWPVTVVCGARNGKGVNVVRFADFSIPISNLN